MTGFEQDVHGSILVKVRDIFSTIRSVPAPRSTQRPIQWVWMLFPMWQGGRRVNSTIYHHLVPWWKLREFIPALIHTSSCCNAQVRRGTTSMLPPPRAYVRSTQGPLFSSHVRTNTEVAVPWWPPSKYCQNFPFTAHGLMISSPCAWKGKTKNY